MNNPHSRSRAGRFIIASFSTSLLLAAAMPGRAGWWPLLFVALVPLLNFISANRPGRCFCTGFVAGFVYHVCLLYWIVIVLGRYGGLPFPLAAAVMLLLSLYMGFYLGVFAGMLSLAAGKGAGYRTLSPNALFLGPALWVGLDWLRGFLFTGFPWMDLGYGLYSQPILIQAADLGGHHLLTFCLVLVNVLVFFLLQRFRGRIDQERGYGKRPLVIACIVLILTGAYSLFRYQQVAGDIRDAERSDIAVVQGNIPQDEKWTPGGKQATLDIYQGLSVEGEKKRPSDLIVWPETALPFYPVNDPLFSAVTAFARKQKTWLLTGAPYYTVVSRVNSMRPTLEYFNSALLISPEGELKGRYSKQHLVPFGEYVPLSRFLPFLEPVVEHIGNFTPGSFVRPLQFGALKAGVLICFESIFPELARKQVAAGAQLLVNLTNDAWYGRSSAPYQSFAMTVFRGLETRRSVVRAANTGISGFVDPLGRVIQASPLFERLVLVGEVPVMENETIFVRFGFFFGPACLILAVLLFFISRRKTARFT
jgi:apolipoprotein N-acyltransferase